MIILTVLGLGSLLTGALLVGTALPRRLARGLSGIRRDVLECLLPLVSAGLLLGGFVLLWSAL